MDLQLKGRRTLVTGSSSGIGEETARMLSEEGARVVVHGRNRERAEKIAAEIGAAGVAIGELRDEAAIDAIHAQAVAVLGGNVEILVNNAGGNMLGAVQFCQLCVPDMVETKFGRIINVSSAVAMQPNNVGADYSAAKTALNNFTVSLAGSLKGVNVTANILTPGVIVVDGLLRFGRVKFNDPDLTFEQVSARFAEEKVFDVPPVGRFGFTHDLAMVACLLASPLSGFITGANYRVDGGQSRGLN